MDCVLLLTERFYTPLPRPNKDLFNKDHFKKDLFNKDPFDKDPFRSLVQPALVMLLLPKGIYPLFNKLYKSI
jgi:hypothetical protein